MASHLGTDAAGIAAHAVGAMAVPIAGAACLADAVRAVRPWGAGLCSDVRTGGALDAAKLRAFVSALRAA